MRANVPHRDKKPSLLCGKYCWWVRDSVNLRWFKEQSRVFNVLFIELQMLS